MTEAEVAFEHVADLAVFGETAVLDDSLELDEGFAGAGLDVRQLSLKGLFDVVYEAPGD